jgi:rhodanese-related sulfurtransferase
MFSFSSAKAKQYEDVPAKVFHDLMTKPDSLVIDVRTAGEFAGGKLSGAQNIDITSSSFASQIKNLPKGKTYLIYCRSGNRSGQACEMMGREGFENINNLAGGISRWPFETA